MYAVCVWSLRARFGKEKPKHVQELATQEQAGVQLCEFCAAATCKYLHGYVSVITVGRDCGGGVNRSAERFQVNTSERRQLL